MEANILLIFLYTAKQKLVVCTNKLSEINQTVGGFNQFQRTPGGTGYEMSNRTQYENIPRWTHPPNIDKLDWKMGAGGGKGGK